MKRLLILSAALIIMALTGCGKINSGAEGDATLSYKLLDNEEEKKLSEKYYMLQDLPSSDDDEDFFEHEHLAQMLREDSAFANNFKSVEEMEKVLRTMNVESEVEKMDNITEETLANDKMKEETELYRDKKFNNFYILLRRDVTDYGEKIKSDFYINTVYKKTEFYNDMVNKICNKTGLIYNGTRLGREMNNGIYQKEDGLYTGKNIISFANDAMNLQRNLGDYSMFNLVYRDIPLQMDFYMDRDKLVRVNVFFCTNADDITNSESNINVCPETLTERNMEQLVLPDEYGSDIIKEIMTQCIGNEKNVSGTLNNVKWELKTKFYKGEKVDTNLLVCYFN